MLPPIPVAIVPYTLPWPAVAQRHADRLHVLGSTLVAMHHVGSTSVPGLAAKPVIDLIPVVADLAELDRQRSRIEEPVKLTVELPAQVHGDLLAYAQALGREAGQSAIEPAKLVPPMLTRFMATDRAFAKARKQAVSQKSP